MNLRLPLAVTRSFQRLQSLPRGAKSVFVGTLPHQGFGQSRQAALYTRVANATIRAVTSPLDRLAPLIEERPRPEV